MPTAFDPYRPSVPPNLPPPAPTKGRALRILAQVPRYLPEHNAGAEHTMHAILRYLVGRGWEARVLSHEHRGTPYVWDGVEVIGSPVDIDRAPHWAWTDVGITHLHGTRAAVGWARHGRPLVHVAHNHTQIERERVTPRDAALVVWNSEWVREANQPWGGPQMVVNPPVDLNEYATENPDRFLCGSVTLLNLTAIKGGAVFWRLAKARPDLPFLGVDGAYYLQEPPPTEAPNIEHMDNQVDVVPIYQRTRVLVMPSGYESWGRTAVEAMASGIPVIAAPTPGLREVLTSPTLGPCGLFADVDDDASWLAALAALDDPAFYEQTSQLARKRAAELGGINLRQLADLDHALRGLAEGRSIA